MGRPTIPLDERVTQMSVSFSHPLQARIQAHLVRLATQGKKTTVSSLLRDLVTKYLDQVESADEALIPTTASVGVQTFNDGRPAGLTEAQWQAITQKPTFIFPHEETPQQKRARQRAELEAKNPGTFKAMEASLESQVKNPR